MPITPEEQVAAVTRELRTVERAGEQLRQLVAERTFPSFAPAEVWDALVSPDRIPRWFAPVSGDLRPGGRFQLENQAGGEILACDPPRRLSITWEFGGEVSWVDVVLAPLEDGTRLLLEHTAPVDPEKWDRYGPGAVGIGWEMALMGLREHLLAPDADPQQTAEWMAGPDGMAYLGAVIGATSEAWAEASIAAGTDPEAARLAGARCVAFYTGQPEP